MEEVLEMWRERQPGRPVLIPARLSGIAALARAAAERMGVRILPVAESALRNGYHWHIATNAVIFRAARCRAGRYDDQIKGWETVPKPCSCVRQTIEAQKRLGAKAGYVTV